MPRRCDPNRCAASEVEPLSLTRGRRDCAPPSSPPASRIRPGRPPRDEDEAVEAAGSRLLDNNAKLSIFKTYHEWKLGGSKKSESVIPDLVSKYGIHRTYPKRLYDKVLKAGSVDNKWSKSGRPGEFTPEMWDTMQKLIREKRKVHKKASLTAIKAELTKERVAKRVRKNMLKVIDLKGGNFYSG